MVMAYLITVMLFPGRLVAREVPPVREHDSVFDTWRVNKNRSSIESLLGVGWNISMAFRIISEEEEG